MNIIDQFFSYWMPESGDKKARRVSNFIVTGLYLIKSKDQPARILTLTNEFNETKTIKISSRDFASLQNFRALVEGVGNYNWLGNSGDLQQVKEEIFAKCGGVEEIIQLGWQPARRLYAFSNGVFDGVTFSEVDKMGIVKSGNNSILIPAYSEMYEDSNRYDPQKRFKHTPRAIGMRTWAELFVNTFGSKAYIGIAYFIACAFRDVIFTELRYFPLLFLYGPPESGKSQFFASFQKFFGQKQTVINLESGSTAVGSIRKLEQFVNSLVIFNEFKNSIDPKLVGLIKGIYDGDGRETGEYSNDNRTKQTKVSSGMIIAGQELPAQESAMFTRIILLSFKKKPFTASEKETYDKLHDYEGENSGGLTTCLLEILKYRDYFEQEFSPAYRTIIKDLKANYSFSEDRQPSHAAILLAAFQIIGSYVGLPFSLDELKEELISVTREQIQYMSTSNELSVFWQAFAYLRNKHTLLSDNHYTIKPDGPTLWIRLNTFYSDYMDFCNRSKKPSLNQPTLQNYLQNSAAFLKKDTVRYGPETHHSMGFDLEKLKTQYNQEIVYP
ncbi:MAG: hypothetical protein WCW62_11320 [Bacteroidales bacterium]